MVKANDRDKSQLNDACESLTIGDLWLAAGYPGKCKYGGAVSSPFREDKHPSFYVSSDGKYFKDYAREGLKGGPWQFAQLAWPEDLPKRRAKRLLKLAGLRDKPINRRRKTQSREIMVQSSMPKAFNGEVLASWKEGAQLLRENLDLQTKIATERGWPIHVVESLIAMDLIACPLDPWKRRSVAFKVQGPRLAAFGKYGLIEVGYHQRINVDGKKSWLYCPSKKRNGYSIPALPFVLGDVLTSKLIVLLEGPWDAITFYNAIGGFEDCFDCQIAVFGIRGAQGISPFFNGWGPVIEKLRPSAWVIGDNDEAGTNWGKKTWDSNDSFADLLNRICRKVTVSYLKHDLGVGKDFNDYWKSNKTNRLDIFRAIEHYGILK